MTIKRRLFWSNILMIVVPAAAAALIGILCIGLIWLSLTGGAGLEIEDQEDFDHAGMAISEMFEYGIWGTSDFSPIKPILDNNHMSLQIVSDEKVIFEYGSKEDADEALLSAARLLGGSLCTITLDGRSLYVEKERVKGEDYIICLFGNYHGRQTYSEIKVALTLSAIVILFTIFVSILLTNRFLTKFVFKRIEETLHILAGGVHEIRDGNLEYRIVYDRKDEFQPVCEDFNEMAARLKSSVDGMQRQELSRKDRKSVV